MVVTAETQNPGAGAGDPAVFSYLIAREHESCRQAKRSGDQSARLTCALAVMDLIELRKEQRATALPSQSGKEVTDDGIPQIAKKAKPEDLTAPRCVITLLSKPAGGSPPAGEIGGEGAWPA